MRRELIMAVVVVVVSGCSSPGTSIVLQPNSPVAIPPIQGLDLNPVQFQVLTLDQLQKLLADMQAHPQQKAMLFALDADNYDNLSLNLIELQRYVEEQKAVLTMLKNIIAARSRAATPGSR